MGCRCAERRSAIITATRAIASGDARTAAAQAGFVARTSVQDARSAFAGRVAAARIRLTR